MASRGGSPRTSPTRNRGLGSTLGNLLLARAIQRRSEFAVRLALGARRRHLVGLVFAEALILAVSGGIAAAGLARWMIELLVRMTPIELPRSAEIGHGLQIPIVTVVLVLVAALLVSAPPALEVARSRQSAGAGMGSRATSRRFARQLMVAAEMAIALTLLVGAALMARTILALRGGNPGYRTDHLVALQIYLPKTKYREPPQIRQFFATFFERLRVTPGVAAVAASSGLPAGKAGIDFDLPIQVPGRATETSGQAAIRVVNPEYFKAMGIPVIQGRAFDDRDREPQSRKVMINRSFIKKFLPEAPSVVGRQLVVFLRGPETYEIIGAVADVHNDGMLGAAPKPEFYLPFTAKPISGMGVAVRTSGEPVAFARVLRGNLWALDPDLPASSVDAMEHMVTTPFNDRSFLATLLVLFALVAVALTALGVFSVMSFSVSQQVREIGIRMAMGARSEEVLHLVMRQAARVALTGVAFGLCGAWLLGRGLASLIYGVSAADPWVFLGGAVFVGLVAALGAYLPSRWASRIDPVAALRIE